MTGIRKREPLAHAVIVDSNILWHDEKAFVANPAFDEFWEAQAKTFQLELIVPEVVKGELMFQQAASALRATDLITEMMVKVSAITEKRYSHRISEVEVKGLLERKFLKWLRSHGGKVESTPLKKIDWQVLVEAAIWHKPPFEYDRKHPDNEKGFRDALILETVVEFCTRETRGINLAFLCNDKLLRESAEGRLSDVQRFATYESIADFESYLRLAQEELTTEFIKSIRRRASEKFFTGGDRTCLASREDLLSKLKTTFSEYFDNPARSGQSSLSSLLSEGGATWSPASQGIFWVGPSQFKRLEGKNTYHWLSVVTYARRYQSEGDVLTRIEAPRKETAQKTLLLPFHVSWKSRVTKAARFHDVELEDMKLKDNIFKELSDEESREYDFATEST